MKARGDTVGVEVRRDGMGCRSRDGVDRRACSPAVKRQTTMSYFHLSHLLPVIWSGFRQHYGGERFRNRISRCSISQNKLHTFSTYIPIGPVSVVSILELKLWLCMPTWLYTNIWKLWNCGEGEGVGFYNWTFVFVASPFIWENFPWENGLGCLSSSFHVCAIWQILKTLKQINRMT